ncbi:MAG: metallophosphoesterase [Clostridia bacterium]|nr:metallophosphoesterase [Clostridia bacterium]
MMKKASVAIGAAAFAALISAAISDNMLTVSEYRVGTGRLCAPLRVTALSDLHTARFGRGNKRLIRAVAGTDPDMILLAGDFFDKTFDRTTCDAACSLIGDLSELAPVYFTPGNHDMRTDVEAGVNHKQLAQSAGAVYFDGGYIDRDLPQGKIRIGGIFDYGIYPEDYGEHWHGSAVYRFMRDFEDTDRVSILILHRPNTLIYTRGQNDDWNIDAVISGHDHGGLWRLPFVGGLFCPEQGFFPEFTKGEYAINGTRMFLSSGLDGYYMVPRMFNPPEIMSLIFE